MLLLEYYDQQVDLMEEYLNGIDEDLCRSIEEGPYHVGAVEVVGSTTSNESLTVGRFRSEANDKICIRELRGALPPIVFNYVHGCKTAQEIWNSLKDKFQGTKRTKKSFITQCLPELFEFKHKENESNKMYYVCFNGLVYKCSKYKVVRIEL